MVFDELAMPVANWFNQLATGESEPTREDATSSDIITGSLTAESGITSSSLHMTHLESELPAPPQVTDTCKEKNMLIAVSAESNSESCNKPTTPETNLSVSTILPSPGTAGGKIPAHEAENAFSNKDDRPDDHQTAADKLSGINSGLVSETGSTAPESTKNNTPEQVTDKKKSNEIQNPSGNSDVNKNHTNTEQNKCTKKTSRKEDKVVKDKKCYSDDQNIQKRQKSTSLGLPTKGTIKRTKVL